MNLSKRIIYALLLLSIFSITGCSKTELSMTTEEFVKEIYLKLGPNETTAKYKDKTIELTGTLIEKGTIPESDRLYILIYENKPGRLMIAASFPSTEGKNLNAIKNGDFVKVKGTFPGVLLQKNNWTRLTLENAQIVN